MQIEILCTEFDKLCHQITHFFHKRHRTYSMIVSHESEFAMHFSADSVRSAAKHSINETMEIRKRFNLKNASLC